MVLTTADKKERNKAPLKIAPLSAKQQQHVIDETHAYINTAERLFDIKLKPVEILFNLNGRAAGMYRIRTVKKGFFARPKREIRYNAYIFAKYFDDNYGTTIPHEVAHYIADMRYGLNNIKPHGSEWKKIMLAFNADSSVTADYDLSGIPLKKQQTHTYVCDCQQHQISMVRHNRITKNQRRYFCKTCKQFLRHMQ